MYLYDISQQNKKRPKCRREIKQTRLKKKLSKNITKKLSRKDKEKEGGGCFFGFCRMPRDIYKSTKQTLLQELIKALGFPTNEYEKYKYILKKGLDKGFLRMFLHGIYSKMGSSKRDLLEETYIEYIKKFVKLIILSASPDIDTNHFPTEYYKYNQKGESVDETDSRAPNGIPINKNFITTDALANYLDTIIKADKQNLQYRDAIKEKDIKKINRFIMDDTVASKLQLDETKKYAVNQVLYYYNSSLCTINEKGILQQSEMCNVIFMFNTKKSVSVVDRDLEKKNFAFVESNFKIIKTYVASLISTTNKSKVKLYTNKIVSLLTDSYKIKEYVEGCMHFFNYMDKYKDFPKESPGLFKDKRP